MMLKFTIAALLISAATSALGQVAPGTYVSLDGVLEHQLKPTGDYVGKRRDEQETSGARVYQQGADICWVTREDGSRKTGDLMLYVGEVQCCLSVAQISDKFTFEQIWVEGVGFGYGMCKNQVFQRGQE
ncbi:MAG: hypothetical protein J0I48_06755 [Devosia sp.]|uniref:hypothetical protein n=1 Tax=Devosia sp. 66-22 TaxID=1895753 RepID=UPI001ACFC71E|nr:hypothetical protein [Devosia sp. 66-22]MBN9345892.1 hypothetical protein [Devosia sp.]